MSNELRLLTRQHSKHRQQSLWLRYLERQVTWARVDGSLDQRIKSIKVYGFHQVVGKAASAAALNVICHSKTG
jgi:hypothetical protein